MTTLEEWIWQIRPAGLTGALGFFTLWIGRWLEPGQAASTRR